MVEMYNDCHLSSEYLKEYAIGDTFIETGTYKGAGVLRALQFGFKTIHSIEIDEELYLENKERFKNNPEVNLHLGDSVDIVPGLVNELGGPATIWLDAHASGPLAGGRFGPCPLVLELRSIYGTEVISLGTDGMTSSIKKRDIDNHTIFIDDRRLLGSAEWGYVSEESVTNLLLDINQDYTIRLLDGHVKSDVIVAYKR